MRQLAALLAAAALAGAAAAPAAAHVRVDGRGWGHGVGLSQYGAYGYALREARDHAWILAHYYPGTRLARGAGGSVRVLLRRTGRPTLCGVRRLRDARGRTVALRERRLYRFTASGTSGLTVTDATTGRRRARVLGPVGVRGGASWCLTGAADNGVRSGAYRGRAVLVRDGRAVLVVNRVGLEPYLLGVVPSEMPAAWPAEALAAQAVVARSYAVRGRRPGTAYDLSADTRSQMYRGLAGESPTASAAVRATAGEVLTYGGAVAETFYFSTSGGRTAANEEVWGGAPRPYLRSVEDPHDDLSPYHRWSVTLADAEAARRLRSVTPGALRRLRVASRTASGRAATVAVTGSQGTALVSAARVQALLGLRSTWFELRSG